MRLGLGLGPGLGLGLGRDGCARRRAMRAHAGRAPRMHNFALNFITVTLYASRVAARPCTLTARNAISCALIICFRVGAEEALVAYNLLRALGKCPVIHNATCYLI